MVWDSYSTEENPTVSYTYCCPNNNTDGTHNLWYTITNNKVTFDSDDTKVIQTVLQVDGYINLNTSFSSLNGFKNSIFVAVNFNSTLSEFESSLGL